MIPFLDQIIPVLVTISGNVTTVPTSVNFTDNANSLYASFATIIGFIAILLSSPGLQTWFSHTFGIRKQQIESSAELVGTLAQELLNAQGSVAAITQLMYNLVPENQREVLDKQVAPVLADIQKSIDKINDTLDKVVPKAHPVLTARVNRNRDINIIRYTTATTR
jgi:hypothetical protein